MTQQQISKLEKVLRNIDKLLSSKVLTDKPELKDVLYLYIQLPLHEVIVEETNNLIKQK